MQPIEKALKLVFDSIGNNYNLPQEEFILDDFGSGETFRNPYFGQTSSKLKFMFGTQKELDLWLVQTKDKYPVVWLVYPIHETYNNNPQSFYVYKNVRLIFAINNDTDKLVQTRLQTTKFILNQLVNSFTKLMWSSDFNKFVKVSRTVNITETFHPNYSTNEQKTSGTVDIWDAITFDCELHLISNCVPKN
jgi:hypothetical protein